MKPNLVSGKYRPSQLAGMAAGGAVLGAIGGAALGSGVKSVGPVKGALAGAVVMGLGEPITSVTTPNDKVKPLPWRIIASAFPAAAAGAAIDLVARKPHPLLVGLVTGGAAGAIGGRLKKIGLGLGIGSTTGLVARAIAPQASGSLVAAASVLAYRTTSGVLWRHETQLDLMGERVPPEQIPYVVPFESRTRYVGADYVKDLAKRTGGTFTRNPTDIGIVPSLDLLSGSTFDPNAVHQLIREFYEHTSRFKLDIEPEWKPWIKPGYWVYKNTVAKPLGQANVPSNVREAQRGVTSYIDTIESDADDTTIRGWVRVFADSGDPIYVGIYTTFRHEDRGYVSVGFPLPNANFTATLQPFNSREHDFLLSSHTDQAFPGHYLSAFENESDEISVVQLNTFGEEIDVYVKDEQLFTDHSFYLSGHKFMTLHYTMRRRP